MPSPLPPVLGANRRSNSSSLRILYTVDPELPVPPHHYGGIERIVDMLTRSMIQRGHDVHVCAHAASNTPASHCPYPVNRSRGVFSSFRNTLAIWSYHNGLPGIDVVHSFGRLLYTLPFLLTGQPVLQSYQRSITPSRIRKARAVARGRLMFAACSKSCAATAGSSGGRWYVIPNGVPADRYTFRQAVPSDAPFVFLGRVEPIKGAHHAIEVARRTGRRLIIAGVHPTHGAHCDYFDQHIAPNCDGTQISYVGPVTDEEKDELLGRAAALLFPIEWEEPFGIVMTEALACGTPVIAFRRGAVPEVVEHGRTGFICDDVDDMVSATKALHTIDRSDCRRAVESRFSSDVIAAQYEDLYRELLAL